MTYTSFTLVLIFTFTLIFTFILILIFTLILILILTLTFAGSCWLINAACFIESTKVCVGETRIVARMSFRWTGLVRTAASQSQPEKLPSLLVIGWVQAQLDDYHEVSCVRDRGGFIPAHVGISRYLEWVSPTLTLSNHALFLLHSIPGLQLTKRNNPGS